MIFYKYSRWLEIHQNYHIWKENMITPRIGKFFLKRPLLTVSNPGVQVQQKVAGPDLDWTMNRLGTVLDSASKHDMDAMGNITTTTTTTILLCHVPQALRLGPSVHKQ